MEGFLLTQDTSHIVKLNFTINLWFFHKAIVGYRSIILITVISNPPKILFFIPFNLSLTRMIQLP
jgi:hypothetical protein